MKRTLLAALLSVITLAATAQTVDTRRKIEVTGSAEQEITPDIIYIGISLKEYFRDNASKKKVEIEDLEAQLQAAITKAGIPQENFTINNISGYTDYWNKKKDPNFLASKQYRLKVSDLNKFNQIISGVDAKGIAYTNIEGYDHSQIAQYRRELKIKALHAAREKAQYLAEAIGEKVGGALEIQEINNEYYPQPVYRTANMAVKAEAADGGYADPNIDFKKIKLNYQMRTVFELK